MRAWLCFWIVVLSCGAGCARHTDLPPASLLTTAELSGFRATARYDEVVGLMDRLAASSPLARRLSMGATTEGRDIPLLIIADPPVTSAAEARRQARRDGKLIVLAIGNIHAGEVDGKEALPMLARELLASKNHPLLKNLIIALAPIYNADGNERVSLTNRPGQLGPAEGMGIRENARGLDLNRDFVKIEAPETAGLVGFFREWDPDVFIDTHTTNGSHHRFLMTFAGPKLPAGDAELNRYSREQFFPAVQARYTQRTGGQAFWYGSFEGAFTDAPRGHTRWETFPAEARYGTNYVGLRNRLSILSEAYSYSSYEQRVLGTLAFVWCVLQQVSDQHAQIAALLRGADARAVAAGNRADEPRDQVAIRTRAAAWPGKTVVLGFEEVVRDGKSESTGIPVEYQVDLVDHFEPTLSVTRPWAYVLPDIPGIDRIAAKLVQHGIGVGRLSRSAELPVEAYNVVDASPASRAFQDHVLVKVDAKATATQRRFDPGAYVVRTGQPLGSLVCYLLEPACEDGLATWNYFDPWLHAGAELPVYRLMKPVELPLQP